MDPMLIVCGDQSMFASSKALSDLSYICLLSLMAQECALAGNST